MTDLQMRTAAKQFVKDWTGHGDEKQETQRFWMALLQKVFGVSEPDKAIEFEVRVKLDHTSFIDGYIKDTHVLIEQKGADIDLSKGYKQSDGSMLTPFQQARRYAGYLPHNMNPRWIVVCNFKEFHIHDMNRPNDTPEIIKLEDLETEYTRLQFLVDKGNERIQKEMEISLQAGELVGKLYDALLKQYNSPASEEELKSLNMLCVRLVFCLYAEDAGIFGSHTMFHDYLKGFQAKNVRKALIKNDLIGITEAINICSEETRAHFMLGGLLYIATVVNGAIEWCEKANINVQSFIDTELITKLRTKAKLYSSDKLIPLEKQKKLMSSIVSTEKQYWIDQQDESRIPYPDFLIPDVGSYIVNGHYIGNTLEYAYEFSPLNPKKIPILEAICGNSKEESLIYKIAIQIGQTMSSLYDTLGIQRGIKKHYDEITIVTKDHDFKISNHTFFEKENAIYAFNLLCRVNFLLEMLLPLNKNGFLSFRMMYITFYHLKFDLENLGLKEIHYNMPYRNKLFRNAMAHYSLFGKLSTAEIIDNVTGYGLFEKFFEEPFEVINQVLINELAKTRDSLEQYVVF